MRARKNSFTAADVGKFWKTAYGYLASSVLFAGVEFDLFTLLDRRPGLSLREMAERLRVPEQPLKVLLIGLVNVGLLQHAKGTFVCSPLAEKLLSRDSRENIVPILEWHYRIVYKGMYHLPASIRTGKNEGLAELPGKGNTLYERLTSYPELERIFQEAMSCISGRERASLLGKLPWKTVRRVVDLGGGDGTNVRAIAEKYPHIRATVFDLPSVCEIARRKAVESPAADRVSVESGNFISDPLPPADCYLLAHITPIYSEQTIRGVFKKTFDALPSGGKLVVFTMMGNDDYIQPFPAAVGSAYFLAVATGEGMIYPSKDYLRWLKDAGYSTFRKFNFANNQVCLLALK